MGTPEDLSICRAEGIAYCDQASRILEQKLGHPPDLEEVATYYASAAGSMQGAMVAVLHEMSGMDDVRAWFSYVCKITQAVAREKKAPFTIEPCTVLADGQVPVETAAVALENNGHAQPPETLPAPGESADAQLPPAVPLPCACFNKTGMCVVCLEGLVARLVKAGAWISQVQDLSGTLEADCPACTPRIIDRAVANAIRKSIDRVRPENRAKILSAVISALPQLTGLEDWDETFQMAERLTEANSEPSDRK